MNQLDIINETDRLLPKGGREITTWNRYLSIVAIVLLYKGAEEMYLSTSRQYIYYWFKQSIARRNATFKGGNFSTSTNCPGDENVTTAAENEAQASASNWELYFDVMKYSIALFTLPIYGSLSDYLGRKFIIVLPIIGGFLRASTTAVIIHFELDIPYLLIAHASDGLLGTSLTQSVATYSVTADITPMGRSRTVGMAFMECLKGVGKFSSSTGTGYFIKRYGYLYPTLTSAGVCLFATIIGIFWFSETREKQKKRSISALTLYRNVTDFYTRTRKGRDRSTFWVCMIVFVMVVLPLLTRNGLLTLLQLGSPFCWPSDIVGWYDSALTFATFIIGLFIIKPLLSCFSHGTTGILALLCSIGFYALTALAKDNVMLFAAVAVGTPMLLPLPIIRGIASQKASPEKQGASKIPLAASFSAENCLSSIIATISQSSEQGALLAGLTEAEVVCNLVSTSVFNTIYSQSVSWMRGFTFIVMAATNIVALVFMIWLSCIYRVEEEITDQVIVVNESRDD